MPDIAGLIYLRRLEPLERLELHSDQAIHFQQAETEARQETPVPISYSASTRPSPRTAHAMDFARSHHAIPFNFMPPKMLWRINSQARLLAFLHLTAQRQRLKRSLLKSRARPLYK